MPASPFQATMLSKHADSDKRERTSNRSFVALVSCAAACVALCPAGCGDGKNVATANNEALRLDGSHNNPVTAIAISPDDKLILVGGNGRVGIYTLSDFKSVGETKTMTAEDRINACDSLVFAADGLTFVVHDRSRGNSEWEMKTGHRIPAPRPFTPQNASFDWLSRLEARHVSPDGQKKLVIREDTSPRQVDVRSTAPNAGPLIELAHHGIINDATFSPDGKWIVTASGSPNSGRFQIWDAKSGAMGAERITGQQVTSLAFTSDGQILLTAHGFEVTKWTFDSLLPR